MKKILFILFVAISACQSAADKKTDNTKMQDVSIDSANVKSLDFDDANATATMTEEEKQYNEMVTAITTNYNHYTAVQKELVELDEETAVGTKEKEQIFSQQKKIKQLKNELRLKLDKLLLDRVQAHSAALNDVSQLFEGKAEKLAKFSKTLDDIKKGADIIVKAGTFLLAKGFLPKPALVLQDIK